MLVNAAELCTRWTTSWILCSNARYSEVMLGDLEEAYIKVTCSMIGPAADCIDESSRIERANLLSQTILGPRRACSLAPFLIINSLKQR